MPGVAQDSSANPEPSARKHSDKRRRSVSPKGDLPSSKRSRHDTVAAPDTAQGDHSARSSRPCHSADSLPSSSDPWMVPRSPYHPFPVPGYPPYPGYPVPPPFVPPPMFPTGPYWPPSYAMPPPPPDPRLYEDNRSRDRGSDPPRKATQKTKHLRSPPSSESERPAPSASDSEGGNGDSDDDRGASSQDSNVAESSPPASSDAIPNYPEFVKRMASTLNIPPSRPFRSSWKKSYGTFQKQQRDNPVHTQQSPPYPQRDKQSKPKFRPSSKQQDKRSRKDF
ncbi:hypothetical protein JRQ81_008008 [Phrynocephalus forsythii]|uniref:Uncharacterized protein n=1 Tax=Phrynocephalus forsythii TaxID=171643 RepID=A0A9Q0Y533_9SAUR|nr:hypothetical protein JRQ81_008008 [Phrynocephalus forsythii]